MMDVSQVLEFPSAKPYLLKQLSVTKTTQISTSELTLNRSRLLRGWELNGGSAYSTTRISKKRAPQNKDMLKVLTRIFDPRITGTLTILSRRAVFTLCFLIKKYAKLRLLILIPLLKLVVCLTLLL